MKSQRRGMVLIARATSRAASDADVPGAERSAVTADDHTD